ncbi:MAG: leucyl aminopeptidase [Nitrospirae bacterium]|nr:leucyl aminopeptidase [Nitrospirota bacterium]
MIKIALKNLSEEIVKTDALIIPLFEGDYSGTCRRLDSLIGNYIKTAFDSGEFIGKHNQATILHINGIKASRILLLGLGKKEDLTAEKIRQCGGKAACILKGIGAKDSALSTSSFNALNRHLNVEQSAAFYFIEGVMLASYRFDRYRKNSDASSAKNNFLKGLTILNSKADIPVDYLKSTSWAVAFAKDLVNTPSNDMTPTILAQTARSLASKKIRAKILERKDADREGMGAYLAVAKGSDEPPKFIVLEYQEGKGAPVVLVGKSITFDSGGLSLKPADGMEKMKYDMAGGAAVLGVMKAVVELGLKLNLIAILPATENLPGGSATRPGDIVSTVSGKTVEIANTDAEGRLVLIDAIGYAKKYFKPRAIIDIATLTGACSVALGNEAMAMMGNDDELMERLKKSAAETYERVWQMPLYEEYKDYLKSDTADIKNIGGRNGSLVTAAYFIKEFVGDTPWVHLDIAGTAFSEKDRAYTSKGATGIGVRLLIHFLKGLY